MNQYMHMHNLESECKYNICSHNNAYASFIHENYNKMDVDEMRILVSKILSDKQVKQILLDYELTNYTPIKKHNISLESFINEFNNVVNKFQWKSGGFNLEDRKWYIYKYGDEEHTLEGLKENQILFENSIDVSDSHDVETQNYLNKLMGYLKNISDNIKIDFKVNNKLSKSVLFLQIIVTHF